MLYKDYVKNMNLADAIHQLELACHYKNPKVDKFRYEIYEMLLAVDPDGKQNFLFKEDEEKEGKNKL